MVELLVVVVGIAIAAAIALYATWLFVHRLRAGESKAKSFGEWLKHIFEAIMGL
jgi:Tfp pilus assembly protein PilE